MGDHHQQITHIATTSTYTVSASLMLGDAWHFLNNNAGAIGASIAILTYLTNFYYQRKRDKREEKDDRH